MRQIDEEILSYISETKLFNDVEIDRLRAEDVTDDANITAAIVRMGLAGEEDYLKKLAEVLGLEYIDVSEIKDIDTNIVNTIQPGTAFQYNTVPVAFDGNILTVAISDPFSATELEDCLRIATGHNINTVLCVSEKITKQAQRYYGVGGDTLAKMIEEGRYDADSIDTMSRHDLNSVDSEEASIVKFVNQVIGEADRQGATDIHIEPQETELRIRYRIDGMLHKIDVAPQLHKLQSAIISRIKVMANLDIAEKRLPMDGRIGIHVNRKDIDIRVSTCPTIYGESISLRLLQKGGGVVRMEQLGLNERDADVITRAIHRPNGIVLVTGPTGSGKSTSLYAFLHEINTVDKRILTAEEPVEYEMPGINQVLVKPDIGLTFANVLRSFLRQDPDIMMVGEIRDRETAEIAINASLTGHLVFSTLHTNDAAGAFARLIDMNVEPFLVASSVAAVLAQRLLRRLCPVCKAPAEADPQLLRAMHLDPELFKNKVIHHVAGCQQCGKSGYKGRGAIFEVLNVTDALRQLITEHRPSSIIKAKAIEEGMTTLRDDGWNKVFSGFTTIEEVLRVTEDQEA